MHTIRQRMGEFDLVGRLGGRVPGWIVQIAFGLACAGAAIVARAGIDTVSPGAGPFALLYLAVLLATLYGRLLAGLVAWAGGFLHTWYVVLPTAYSFTFANGADAPRAAINGVVALLSCLLAEIFRRAVRRAADARDRELATNRLLMRELEHRTKNNFAMVAGLLSLQRRASASEDVRSALAAAMARVNSFSAIHESIYATRRYSEEIDVRQYLETLTTQLQAALFPEGRVRITLDCLPAMVGRDQALNFGMIVTEVVTNAEKHAFPDGRTGAIEIAYRAPAGGMWELSIRDDGVGMPDGDAQPATRGSGIGTRLIEAFAVAVEGELATERMARGTRTRLTQRSVPEDGA